MKFEIIIKFEPAKYDIFAPAYPCPAERSDFLRCPVSKKVLSGPAHGPDSRGCGPAPPVHTVLGLCSMYYG